MPSTRKRADRGVVPPLLLVFLWAAAVAAPAPGGLVLAQGESAIDSVEARRSCGRKSLLAWLRLVGCDPRYEELVSCVPVAEKGTSLREMLEGASHWRDGVSLVKVGDNQLASIPLPAIAHGWLDGSRATEGHYVVVVAVLPTSVVCLDVASGMVQRPSRAEFQSFASGYMLIAESNRTLFWPCLYWGSAALSLLVGMLLVRYWRQMGARVTQTLMLALAGVTFSGCAPSGGIDSGSAGSAGTATSNPPVPVLRVSASRRELGTVALGSEARATFTLSNVSEAPVELRLGRPSCGCLTGNLDRERLDPRETAQLELVLNGNRQGYAGRSEGSITVGTTGSEAVYLFTAKGVIEGMKTPRYAMRLPAHLDGFSPDAIRGEIAVGLKHLRVPVRIREVRVEDGSDFLELEEPVVGELEQMTTNGRYSFAIPVRLKPSVAPRIGTYPVRITYSIGDTVSDHYVAMYIFPLAGEASPTVGTAPKQSLRQEPG